MPEKELDLIQFSTRCMTQLGARTPQIMRCYLGKPEFSRVLFHDVPDYSFRYAVTPVFACSTDTSEQVSRPKFAAAASHTVDSRFDPVGHRNGSNVPAFANQINYRPMLLALLQVREVQISQFAASKSAAQQDGENRPIPLSFEGVWRQATARSDGLLRP